MWPQLGLVYSQQQWQLQQEQHWAASRPHLVPDSWRSASSPAASQAPAGQAGSAAAAAPAAPCTAAVRQSGRRQPGPRQPLPLHCRMHQANVQLSDTASTGAVVTTAAQVAGGVCDGCCDHHNMHDDAVLCTVQTGSAALAAEAAGAAGSRPQAALTCQQPARAAAAAGFEARHMQHMHSQERQVIPAAWQEPLPAAGPEQQQPTQQEGAMQLGAAAGPQSLQHSWEAWRAHAGEVLCSHVPHVTSASVATQGDGPPCPASQHAKCE